MKIIKRIVYNEWFDIAAMSVLLMWLSPWDSFDVKTYGFYVCIIVSILSVKTTRYLLKKHLEDYKG